MPQLDKMTWFGQVFWFLITFGTLYLFLAKTGLPAMARGLKARTRMVAALTEAPALEGAKGASSQGLDVAMAQALGGTLEGLRGTTAQAGASAPAGTGTATPWPVAAPAGAMAAHAWLHGQATAHLAPTYDGRAAAAPGVAAEAGLALLEEPTL